MCSTSCNVRMLILTRVCVCVQVPGWVAAALAPDVTLTFLDTDGVRPAAAVEDSLAPGGGVINTGACVFVAVEVLAGSLCGYGVLSEVQACACWPLRWTVFAMGWRVSRRWSCPAYDMCMAVSPTPFAGEAQLVMQLLSGLLAAGVPGGDVGIISPYKAQVNV